MTGVVYDRDCLCQGLLMSGVVYVRGGLCQELLMSGVVEGWFMTGVMDLCQGL